MKRLTIYLLAAAVLPLFSHFQETVTYSGGNVIHAERLYDQNIGIAIAACIVVLFGVALWNKTQRENRLAVSSAYPPDRIARIDIQLVRLPEGCQHS